jgi:DNA-binding protein H-NS
MEQFKQSFDENGPPGTNRKEILLDFCVKAVMESAEFFIGNVSNEMQLQSTLAQEAIRKLQDEIKEIKSEQKDKYGSLENKLRKTEIQNAELGAREQRTRE